MPPMTGARPGSAGSTLLEQVAARRAAYGAALDDVQAALWDQNVVDAQTLELCRLRIGQLLGASPAPERVDPALADAVSQWPTDARFDARQRTVLAYAEQVLVDAQEVTDAQATAVVDAIGEDGFLVLTYACGFFETTQRAELMLAAGQEDR
jgi:alkylhydroperoxidase family enzyme